MLMKIEYLTLSKTDRLTWVGVGLFSATGSGYVLNELWKDESTLVDLPIPILLAVIAIISFGIATKGKQPLFVFKSNGQLSF